MRHFLAVVCGLLLGAAGLLFLVGLGVMVSHLWGFWPDLHGLRANWVARCTLTGTVGVIVFGLPFLLLADRPRR